MMLVTVALTAIALLIGYSVGFDIGERHAIKRINGILRAALLKEELKAKEIEMLNAKAQLEEWVTPSDSPPPPDHPES